MHFSENMKGWHWVYEDCAFFLYQYCVQKDLFENCLGYLQWNLLMKTCIDTEQVILMCFVVSSLAYECCLLLTLACFIFSYLLTDTGSVKHMGLYVKSLISSIRLLHEVLGFAPTISFLFESKYLSSAGQIVQKIIPYFVTEWKQAK